MLQDISFSINIEKQSTTKYTPFYLLFGRNAIVPRELDTENDTIINFYITEENIKNVENDILKRSEVKMKVLENIASVQIKQKKRYKELGKSKIKLFVFKIGDLVLRRILKIVKNVGGRTLPMWLGSYEIIYIDNRNRLTLKDLKTNKVLKKKYSHIHLKPYNKYYKDKESTGWLIYIFNLYVYYSIKEHTIFLNLYLFIKYTF